MRPNPAYLYIAPNRLYDQLNQKEPDRIISIGLWAWVAILIVGFAELVML